MNRVKAAIIFYPEWFIFHVHIYSFIYSSDQIPAPWEYRDKEYRDRAGWDGLN